jgi:hypothetical protein
MPAPTANAANGAQPEQSAYADGYQDERPSSVEDRAALFAA